MGMKAVGVFLFVQWGFFVHSNPKVSHLQAVLPKYLFYDKNSDFCFISSLWQLRYLWKPLSILEFITQVQTLPTGDFLGVFLTQSVIFLLMNPDLLCFLMSIKHPRKGKKWGHQSCYISLMPLSQNLVPFFWAFYSLGRSQQHYQPRESSCLRSCLPKLLNLLEPTDIREQTDAVSKDELQKKENKKHPLHVQACRIEKQAKESTLINH